MERPSVAQPTPQRATGGRIPPGAIASLASGIIAVVIMFLPFYTLSVSYLGNTVNINLSGFDLALGTITSAGTSVPLGGSLPIIWLIAIGAGLAAILGFAVVLASRSGDSSSTMSFARRAGSVVFLAGLLAIVSSLIALFQLLEATTSFTYEGVSISSFPNIGIVGSIVMDGLIATAGSRMSNA